MSEEKSLVSFLRDANDIAKLLTGKSIPGLIKRGTELFGRETVKRIIAEPPNLPPNSPYAILGTRPDASTLVIKATFRAMTKDLNHDSEEYQKLNQAYLQILSDRGEG